LLSHRYPPGKISKVASIQEQFANVPGSASEEIASFIEQLIGQGFLGYEMEGAE